MRRAQHVFSNIDPFTKKPFINSASAACFGFFFVSDAEPHLELNLETKNRHPPVFLRSVFAVTHMCRRGGDVYFAFGTSAGDKKSSQIYIRDVNLTKQCRKCTFPHSLLFHSLTHPSSSPKIKACVKWLALIMQPYTHKAYIRIVIIL